jgi:hypothetical protein
MLASALHALRGDRPNLCDHRGRRRRRADPLLSAQPPIVRLVCVTLSPISPPSAPISAPTLDADLSVSRWIPLDKIATTVQYLWGKLNFSERDRTNVRRTPSPPNFFYNQLILLGFCKNKSILGHVSSHIEERVDPVVAKRIFTHQTNRSVGYDSILSDFRFEAAVTPCRTHANELFELFEGPINSLRRFKR